MSQKSKIEWTQATWNPVRGCLKVSPGCKHCYAQTFAERFRNVKGHPYEDGFDPRLVPSKLVEPLTWTSPKTVFVNSMSDLFQDAVPDDFIIAVAEVMIRTPWHTYQILTKRAQRMRELLGTKLKDAALAPHVWWGVSVEDRRHGVPRIDCIRKAPAKVRFLSIEPLLEDLGEVDLADIDWVIVGGESGPGARPMQEEWVEALRVLCKRSSVAFFFKQWGGVQKGKHGRILNGRTYDEMPASTVTPMPSPDERRKLASRLSPLTEEWTANPLIQL